MKAEDTLRAVERSELAADGIEIEETFFEHESPRHLPKHVDALRRALLSFEHFEHAVDATWEEKLRKDRESVTREWSKEKRTLTAKWDLLPIRKGMRAKVDAALLEELTRGEEVAGLARDMEDASEKDWTNDLLKRHIFVHFKEVRPSCTPFDNLFDQWRLNQDVSWLEHGVHGNCKGTGSKKEWTRRCSVPDLAYGFPIFKSKSLSSLPPGFVDHDCSTNFHVEVLAALRKEGLISSVTTGIYNFSENKRAGMTDPDFMCFPWAVIEVKLASAKPWMVQECYLQVVNGTAIALTMLEKLFERAFGSVPHDLPPIIGFTSIGPDIKVWLTYRDEKSLCKGRPMIRMVCIWATSLELTWGTVSTRIILKHMYLWATRILRPRISLCISLIRASKAQQSASSASPTRVDIDGTSEDVLSSGVPRTPAVSSSDLPHASVDSARKDTPISSAPTTPLKSGPDLPLTSSDRTSKIFPTSRTSTARSKPSSDLPHSSVDSTTGDTSISRAPVSAFNFGPIRPFAFMGRTSKDVPVSMTSTVRSKSSSGSPLPTMDSMSEDALTWSVSPTPSNSRTRVPPSTTDMPIGPSQHDFASTYPLLPKSVDRRDRNILRPVGPNDRRKSSTPQ